MGSDERIAAARDEWVRKTVGKNIGACGSPIEELLLFEFLNYELFKRPGTDNEDHAVSRGFVQVVPWPNVYVGQADIVQWRHEHDWVPVYLFQQAPVACDGRVYRADFALFVADWNPCRYDDEMEVGRVLFKCAVEVDGHDFHERTKTQASYDKARDRAMQKAGWSVLLTGSDIYKDAEDCVLETIDFIESKAPWRAG